ncbi:cytochrome P450 [Chloroflexia bacterium SDU3-3]|nr:cytochrome P450 [Chloroflexia bacterium SDU3-3]
MTATQLDFWSAEAKTRIHSIYAHLRDEQPICRVSAPDGRQFWLITRYDDVLAAIHEPRLVKNWRSILSPAELAEQKSSPLTRLGQHMLSQDPPDHTRLRSLVSKAFTPRMMEQMRPRIQQIADGLIDQVQARGSMDLIEDYAFLLPITVIAELLGIPVEDRDRFRAWSDVVVANEPTPARMALLTKVYTEFSAYLGDLVAKRRAEPQEDLISALVRTEEAGDRLSEDELLSMVFLLIVAGHETTVNLIGNGALALLLHPDQRELLRERPELLPSAIEEFLRYDGPVETSTLRFAKEDMEFQGVPMQRGDIVIVVLSSANRDSSRFADADALDITRGDNRHVAFGHGIHYCLGAPLARIEGQIAIGTLFRRLPDLALGISIEELRWRPSTLVRGLQRLPVTFS